jgi:iron-sulfur cluster assembly protein
MLAEREKTASEQGSYFCNERYKVRVFRLPGALLHSGHMVTVTEKAASKIKELLAQEQEEGVSVLRVAVQGGGCSGFQYALGFDRGPQDGDNEVEMHGVRVVIDPYSAPYIMGSEIDFVDALMGAGFAINNPNVTAACGCGSSFQAKEDATTGEVAETHAGGAGCGSGCSH